MSTRQAERRNAHLLSGSVDRPALEVGDVQHVVILCATISELKQVQAEQEKLTDNNVQAQHCIAMLPIIAYPLVLLTHERGDAEEHVNLEVVLPAADEHFGVPVDEIALARALLEPLVMVWRKVAEQARHLGVPVQGGGAEPAARIAQRQQQRYWRGAEWCGGGRRAYGERNGKHRGV